MLTEEERRVFEGCFTRKESYQAGIVEIHRHLTHLRILAAISQIVEEISTTPRYFSNVRHTRPAFDIFWDNGFYDTELYSMGIFRIGYAFRTKFVSLSDVTDDDIISLEPHYKAVLSHLEKLGRCWHDLQEFEDFLMLCEMKAAGETVLIGIEE